MTYNISLPEELVQQVDSAAKKDFSSRSDFVRRALVNELRRQETVGGTTTAQSDYDEAIAAGRQVLQDYAADFKDLANR